MSDYLIHGETLTGIADAIRSKLGGSGVMKPDVMGPLIRAIPTGGLEFKTCNLYIDASYVTGNCLVNIAHTQLTNNKTYTAGVTIGAGETYTLNNVVIGTIVHFDIVNLNNYIIFPFSDGQVFSTSHSDTCIGLVSSIVLGNYNDSIAENDTVTIMLINSEAES